MMTPGAISKLFPPALALALVTSALAAAAAGQGAEPLSVRIEASPGPYYVGEGFELRVGVVAGALRPKIDLPRLVGARAWAISTELRPITATGIGKVVVEQNLYVARFRVVPARAGKLQVPPVQVQQKGRSGRSQPRVLSIESVPLQGRPAEFLGGVGDFELDARAEPKDVRVGQELEFRIKVTGPAAWGMNDRPDLTRLGRLALGLRIEPDPDLTTDEPPTRTFVYRLRPSQAGATVLPPVAIASFEPSIARYVTHVTPGVPIRVVAVPSFDPKTIDYQAPSTAMSAPVRFALFAASLAAIMVGAAVLVKRWTARGERALAFGPEKARRFARKTARSLASVSARNQGTDPRDLEQAARRVYEYLNRYLLRGTGQSLGVLTPVEAHSGVAHLTNSDELATRASELTARCDGILYDDGPRPPGQDSRRLVDDARRLFEALGRVERVEPGG